jgi:hypothetical protein
MDEEKVKWILNNSDLFIELEVSGRRRLYNVFKTPGEFREALGLVLKPTDEFSRLHTTYKDNFGKFCDHATYIILRLMTISDDDMNCSIFKQSVEKIMERLVTFKNDVSSSMTFYALTALSTKLSGEYWTMKNIIQQFEKLIEFYVLIADEKKQKCLQTKQKCDTVYTNEENFLHNASINDLTHESFDRYDVTEPTDQSEDEIFNKMNEFRNINIENDNYDTYKSKCGKDTVKKIKELKNKKRSSERIDNAYKQLYMDCKNRSKRIYNCADKDASAYFSSFVNFDKKNPSYFNPFNKPTKIY